MENKINYLKNECLSIGSLPFKNTDEAHNLIKEYFVNIPCCPQLPKISPKEDMIIQFLENMPGIVFDQDNGKIYLDSEKETFSEELEDLFVTYEEAISDINSDSIDKFAISKEFSRAFDYFTDIIKTTKPKFAKTQITGPFTLATSLTDKENKSVYYDETFREIVIKTLTLKALWQIKEIKKASKETTPIIFLDEPTLSQLGTSAFVTISQDDVINEIKEISDLIKQNDAISAIHCCGKCDWSIPIKINTNIINFDAFSFAENMSLFTDDIKNFLDNGGFIAWGIVPTLDKDALKNTNLDEIQSKLKYAQDLIIGKGIDKNLLLNHSLYSPSCGCGSLTDELALKAIKLTKELSDKMKG